MTAKERMEIEDQWVKWERALNEQLEQTRYRVLYLPPIDLMPYEDGPAVTQIQDEVEKLIETWEEAEENGEASPIGMLRLNEEWARKISMALTVYKTVLLTIHGKRIREEMKEKAENRKEAE